MLAPRALAILGTLINLHWTFFASAQSYRSSFPGSVQVFDDRPPECPPCFNCNLGASPCQQFGNCSTTTGHCSCPPGFGGLDCSLPLCGSPADPDKRAPRPEDQHSCQCDEGWEGLNCNVCNKDSVCNAFTPENKGGICYDGGLVQREMYQMCNITNQKIIKQLGPDKKPQATFSCNAEREECGFQCELKCRPPFHCFFADLLSSLDRCFRILLLRPGSLQLETRHVSRP